MFEANLLMEDVRWSRVTAHFERLLNGAAMEDVLSSEVDSSIREEVATLWQHHLEADREDYLSESMEFDLVPVFQPGQVLLNRFEVQSILGRGGMGEVYRALDRTMREPVALKTVARLLAPSKAIRGRIIAEVQNARRITHPNVCRIHDLFEDGDTVFFSMELLEGKPLSEVLESVTSGEARQIVLQMAEGLHAAHKNGVIHGDFKPDNVMIAEGSPRRAVVTDFGLAMALKPRASGAENDDLPGGGTARFMAPELLSGVAPSVLSDIYAFGMVAHMLLPREGIWDHCTRPEPKERPASLDSVIRRIRPGATRRYWVTGAVACAAAGVGYLVEPGSKQSVFLPAGARLLVNAFHTLENNLDSARQARAMFLTAVQQSPRVHAIADQDLIPVLRRVDSSRTVPLSNTALSKAIQLLRANFWLDADLAQPGGRNSLSVRLYRASDQQFLAESAFRDQPNLIALAQEAALWIRNAAGESKQSLALNPVTLAAYTTSNEDALIRYFDGMEKYSMAQMRSAIPHFAEAVRLDPDFAQARNMLGMALNSTGDYEAAFRELDRAFQLKDKLPERERAGIETNYYALLNDPDKMVETARANVSYYPGEPRYQRLLSYALCRSDQAAEAIQYNRKAVELSPYDDLQRTQLMEALNEAGQFDEALNEFNRAITSGATNPWIYAGQGLAYMGLGRYAEAMAAYEKEPADPENNFDIQGANVLLGRLDEAIIRLRQQAIHAANAIENHRAHEFLTGLYFLSDQPDLALTHSRELTNLPAYPTMARRLDCAAFWANQVSDYESLGKVRGTLSEIEARWPNGFTRCAAAHAEALETWHAGDIKNTERLLLEASGPRNRVLSVFALFDLAAFLTKHSSAKVAEGYWQDLEDRRGLILEAWFPGMLPMSWLNRAIAADKAGDRAVAREYSQKVLNLWSVTNPNLRIARTAGNLALK